MCKSVMDRTNIGLYAFHVRDRMFKKVTGEPTRPLIEAEILAFAGCMILQPSLELGAT